MLFREIKEIVYLCDFLEWLSIKEVMYLFKYPITIFIFATLTVILGFDKPRLETLLPVY